MKKLLLLSYFISSTIFASPTIEEFKENTINFIVPAGPGGVSDTLMRKFAISFENVSKTKTIVTNKPGASGAIGVAHIANSTPNGLTIGIAEPGFAIGNYIMGNPTSPNINKLTPICNIVNHNLIVYVNANNTANNMKELTDNFAKKGKGSYGYVANIVVLYSEKYFDEAKISNIQAIPYRSAAESLRALAMNDIDYVVSDVNTAMPFIESNKIKPIGIGGKDRVKIWPNVPKIQEFYKNLSFEIAWWLLVPSDTPYHIKEHLNKTCREAIKDAGLKSFIDANYSFTVIDYNLSQTQSQFNDYTKLINQLYTKYKNSIDKK